MAYVARELKRDSLGAVERLDGPAGSLVRRLAIGSSWPLSGWLARLLLRRELLALQALRGVPRVPQCIVDPLAAQTPVAGGGMPPARGVLLRSWLPGQPLWQADELAADFFPQLRRLVQAMHARGVCHNDLHKENNILVGSDGWPALVDFQLASVHPRGGRRFARRCAEDLRHIDKHMRRYAAAGAGSRRLPPTGVARWWRLLGKPLYNLLTRRLWRQQRGEQRRPRAGPWPRIVAPLLPDQDN